LLEPAGPRASARRARLRAARRPGRLRGTLVEGALRAEARTTLKPPR